MKKIALAAAAASMMFAGTASAADMAPRYAKAPPPMIAPIYNWTGFYVGINGGGGSAHKCWDLTNNAGVLFSPPVVEGCHDATGGTIGGQIGYRWQASNWVFGLEAQGNWADFTASHASLFFANTTDRTKVEAFGLFTGQVGYAWNNVLLYVKGGAAVTSDRYNTNFTNTGVVIDQAKETRWGAVAGAGIEIGFASNWSVAFEYDHLFMGSRDISFYSVGNVFPVGQFTATDRIRQDVDIATIRVNYRFGGPVVAKY